MGTSKDITKAANYLKNEFEMKDLGKTKFCLGLEKKFLFGHLKLKRIYFVQEKKDEDPLGPEVPYISAIGALMYLASNTRPDIAFTVNLLAKFSLDPTKRHWDEIKHILRYLRGTIDLGLFFPNNSKSQMVGYADAGYLSDPHVGRTKTGYLLTYCGTAIS
ncbi:secreted RxLR effector protein 161-like [Apium graveolens]|uniref:secreted RxLR effector protein 161-like n=1 Tax=Apium graveolens TaxID=4045 RepID=UPI003D7C0FA1